MIDTENDSVLFVCTGNIFRSMTAEYALKGELGKGSIVHVHSAGVIEAPHEIVDFVRDHLQRRSINVSGHIPRKITSEIMQCSTIAVAMDLSHQQQIEERFGVRVPVFNEIAYGEESPMPDVCEAVPDWRNNEEAAREYGQSVMNHIFEGIPRFVERMSEFRLKEI